MSGAQPTSAVPLPAQLSFISNLFDLSGHPSFFFPWQPSSRDVRTQACNITKLGFGTGLHKFENREAGVSTATTIQALAYHRGEAVAVAAGQRWRWAKTPVSSTKAHVRAPSEVEEMGVPAQRQRCPAATAIAFF